MKFNLNKKMELKSIVDSVSFDCDSINPWGNNKPMS